ncbi:MAG: conjugal transfer protein TraN [Sideroxydans sp.]|nr:conjugal transfer protein TraN [Sideroxydans sp.]MDD5056644.1 conjugal transfer protein TraN [Sideroxydans sp.]
MEYVELKISENTSGSVSSNNPAIRFARSRFGAVFLLFVSLLYPLESFSATCQLKTAPICIDSTPCRDVTDSAGNPVKVCLSTAISPPPGALITSASCWQYKAVYDCMDQSSPTYTDTCKQVRDGGSCANYAELSATCNNDLPKLANGACPLFDVKYSCETAPGNPYTETTCSSSTSCVDQNGNPSFCTGPVSQETNTSIGGVAAAQEMARQAGVYADKGTNPAESDPDKILLFKGEGARCSEGMWGLAPNCCKGDSKGASATNALITQQLVAAGWNQIAQAYVGSGYMYDTLLDKTIDLVTKALGAMQQVMGGVLNGTTTIATTASNIAGGAAGVASSISLTNTGDMIGGAIGGAVLGAAAGQYAIKLGANTGFAGTVTAVGSAIGTVGGTYIAGVTMYAGAALWNGTAMTLAGAANAGSQAIAAICTPCMVGMLVFSILMSFAACSPEEIKTQLKLGAPGLCHFVGTYCNTKDILGGCITTMQSYCCFNSRIGRIIQEGAKGTSSTAGQLGSWGSSRTPDCSGIKTTDLNKLDFSKIDLSEFIQDVTANSVPAGNDAANVVATHTQAYFDANQVDPTATDGLLVTGSVQQLAPPAIPMNDTSTLDNPPPSMMACSVAFKVTNMAPDGTTTGDFDISDCNPNAIIALTNQGNCAASPATSLDPSSSDFTSATVSLDGKAKFSITLPPSCFAVTSPPTQNIWKGLVTLSPYGTLGVIDAIWQ